MGHDALTCILRTSAARSRCSAGWLDLKSRWAEISSRGTACLANSVSSFQTQVRSRASAKAMIVSCSWMTAALAPRAPRVEENLLEILTIVISRPANPFRLFRSVRPAPNAESFRPACGIDIGHRSTTLVPDYAWRPPGSRVYRWECPYHGVLIGCEEPRPYAVVAVRVLKVDRADQAGCSCQRPASIIQCARTQSPCPGVVSLAGVRLGVEGAARPLHAPTVKHPDSVRRQHCHFLLIQRHLRL